MARMDLSSIEINTPKNPPRIVVYGDHGIGKTTFATSAPAPIVIRTEKGLAAIRVPAFPIAESFDDVLAAITTLYQEDTPFQTAVIDTLTPPGRLRRPPSPSRGGKEKGHRPVFTRVHRRLMTRWIAGVRAVMTNSFDIVASSG